MWRYSLIRIRRAPVIAIQTLLFSMIMTAALCALSASSKQEAEIYEQTWRSIPVKLTVTDLTGMQSDNLDAPDWVVNVFTGNQPAANSMHEYLKQIGVRASSQKKMTLHSSDQTYDLQTIIGLTTLEADPELNAQTGNQVKWLPGYGESVLGGDEDACLIHESMLPQGVDALDVVLEYLVTNSYRDEKTGEIVTTVSKVQRAVRVAGTHTQEKNVLYVSFAVYEKIFPYDSADSVCGTVLDNELLPTVRQLASHWFTEPDLLAEPVPWDYSWYFFYQYALDIDDSKLLEAKKTMEDSIFMNQICTGFVFLLAAGASFFAGFLMIRSRKQEIILMRTMGTPPIQVFGSFALEQTVCVVMGVLLGGIPFLWRPFSQLLLFVAIYAVGFAVALFIFLKKDLMAAIKEDE